MEHERIQELEQAQAALDCMIFLEAAIGNRRSIGQRGLFCNVRRVSHKRLLQVTGNLP